MMRKIIVAMAMMLGFQMSQAQTVNEIFREFRGEEDAVCMKVPWLPIKLIGLFADDGAGQIAARINSVRIMDLSECPAQVQERFAAKMEQLKLEGYEPLLVVKDDGSSVKMWGQMKGEKIKELLIGVSGDDNEPALICIKGNLRMDDLNFSMSENNITLRSAK